MLQSFLLNMASIPMSYDPFRDPIWQFIGVALAALVGIITVAGLIIGIMSFRQQQRKKEVTYQVVSEAPLVSVNRTVKNRVEIRLDGNVVENARLLVLKVWNSGNTSIKTEDYFEPIILEFKGGKIISSEILETTPVDLIDPKAIKTFLKIEAEALELPKFPLNPNDLIAVKVLILGESTVRSRGRIAEGKIKEFQEEYGTNKNIKVISRLTLLMLPYTGVILILNLIINFDVLFYKIFSSFLIAMVFICIYTLRMQLLLMVKMKNFNKHIK